MDSSTVALLVAAASILAGFVTLGVSRRLDREQQSRDQRRAAYARFLTAAQPFAAAAATAETAKTLPPEAHVDPAEAAKHLREHGPAVSEALSGLMLLAPAHLVEAAQSVSWTVGKPPAVMFERVRRFHDLARADLGLDALPAPFDAFPSEPRLSANRRAAVKAWARRRLRRRPTR